VLIHVYSFQLVGLGPITRQSPFPLATSLRVRRLQRIRTQRENRMNAKLKLSIGVLAAAAAGAGMMFLFDPAQGRRRRAELAQRAGHWGLVARREARGRGDDLRQRLTGVVARTRGWLQRRAERPATSALDEADGLEPLDMAPPPLDRMQAPRRVWPALAIAAPVALAAGAAWVKRDAIARRLH
jgi:hypothetical protein